MKVKLWLEEGESGIKYTPELIESALKTFMELDHPNIYDGPNDLTNLVGTVESIDVSDGEATADINLLPTPTGKHIKEMLESNPNSIKFTPFGIGRVLGDKVVDYEIRSIGVFPNFQ